MEKFLDQMQTDQIMSAIFLIAVLALILPGFLSTNNRLREFLRNFKGKRFHDFSSFLEKGQQIIITKNETLKVTPTGQKKVLNK